jgi:hypothetical protein
MPSSGIANGSRRTSPSPRRDADFGDLSPPVGHVLRHGTGWREPRPYLGHASSTGQSNRASARSFAAARCSPSSRPSSYAHRRGAGERTLATSARNVLGATTAGAGTGVYPKIRPHDSAGGPVPGVRRLGRIGGCLQPMFPRRQALGNATESDLTIARVRHLDSHGVPTPPPALSK